MTTIQAVHLHLCTQDRLGVAAFLGHQIRGVFAMRAPDRPRCAPMATWLDPSAVIFKKIQR